MHLELICQYVNMLIMRDKSQIIQFGRNLCAERNRRGLSQDELGQKASMDGTYIGRIERAEVNPTLTTIISLLNALEVSFDVLYKQ